MKNKKILSLKRYTSCRFASGELPSVGSAQLAVSELAGKGGKGG